MARGGGGENTKKAAGNAKKAEVAAQKKAAEDAKKAEAESTKWSQGSRDTSKADQAAAKQADAARKAAEKKALLAEEEASLPSKPGKKPPVKKSRGLDLSGLDAPSSKKDLKALNASNIDDALDALSLTKNDNSEKIDRHPERRFKAAFAAFEERRLEEMKSSGEGKGLRRNQMIEQIRKEFEKHPDNPFNQVNAGRFDLSKEEMAQMKEANKDAVENRLAG